MIEEKSETSEGEHVIRHLTQDHQWMEVLKWGTHTRSVISTSRSVISNSRSVYYIGTAGQ